MIDPTALVNVITGILEYYLIQICRCTSGELRERLSAEKESGQISESEFSLAGALLELLDAQHGEAGKRCVL